MINQSGKYTNQELSEIFENIATAYEIKKANRFRIISYQNIADTLATYPESIQTLWQKDPKLVDQIPGVGEAILDKLDYLFTKNKLHPHIVTALKNIHPAVFTLTKVNGIGPIIAYKLTQNLKFAKTDPFKIIHQLISYASKNKIKNIPTFGDKSQNQILENATNFLSRKQKMTLDQASIIATDLIDYLHQYFPDLEIVALGSLRRKSPLVGDIDLAAKSTKLGTILDVFTRYPQSLQTLIKGSKKASLKLKDDIRADLMIQPPQSWGSLLVHFTGSKAHNIKLREFALKKNFSISEYGIKDLKTEKLNTFTNETDYYHFLGLNFIPPEKRLGLDEIEQAIQNKL